MFLVIHVYVGELAISTRLRKICRHFSIRRPHNALEHSESNRMMHDAVTIYKPGGKQVLMSIGIDWKGVGLGAWPALC